MDKIVMHAVAGAGKTTYLIEKLDLEREIAIITFTLANQSSIRDSVINKFGRLPNNIKIFGVFEFLYSFCFRPLNNNTNSNNGLSFDHANFWEGPYTSDGRIYSNHLSKVIIEKSLPYLNRIDKYFDSIYIDEFQDFSSYDFDWLVSLAQLKIEVILVGDFYQSTLATSRLGNKNINLHKNMTSYRQRFIDAGFKWNEEELSGSYRCPEPICKFINKSLDIDIYSRKENINSEVKYINDRDEIDIIMKDNSIKKLFYQQHKEYKCNSDNWGNSKGTQHENVCVILNPTTFRQFRNKTLDKLAARTFKTFYVACTRTKNNLYFIEEDRIKDKYRIES